MEANTQKIRDLRQWLCWRTEERDSKSTKVPYSPLTGERASSTDPKTWASYSAAVMASKEKGYGGIGFVFTPEDDLCGIDLDSCMDTKSGEIEPWAQEIIEELDSYTEISPSGTGVHVLVRGTLPAGHNRKGRFEAYDRGRYFTVTGRHLSGTPRSIESRQDQLERVVGRVFLEPESSNGHKAADHPPYYSSPHSDEEVIEKARTETWGKFDRLWRGDVSDYGDDHSAADDGFVHKLYSYTQDEEQIKRIHAMSALHRPEKSGKRADYLQRSIERARENVTWFYQWPDVLQLRPHGNSVNGHNTVAEIEDVCAASVTTKPVEWEWRGRIPSGKLTIFDGDPDLGKSVVTIDIAARKSTGRGFPDGATCKAGNVLIVNVEDGVADTIVPRLKAHGADLSRVFIFSSSVPDGRGGTRLLDLPGDIALLENKVIQREAQLLIIDPVLTMLGGDANKDQDARKALTPIRDMAERTGVAVIAVRHLNKSVGLKAIQRGGGNMGLIGVARAGSFFAEHPDDDRLRIMAPHKSNLAEKPPSLSYRIVSSTVHSTARVEWCGVTEHDANSLAAGSVSPHERTALDDAKEFLREELADGLVMSKQVLKDAREAGHSEITVRRAKTDLRVKSERLGTEGWAWRLPDDKGDRNDRVDQDDHLDHFRQEVPENSPYLREDDQGDQGAHADHRDRDDHVHLGAEECIHGYVSGAGCYCCDPNHPYHLKEEVP